MSGRTDVQLALKLSCPLTSKMRIFTFPFVTYSLTKSAPTSALIILRTLRRLNPLCTSRKSERGS